VLRCIKTVVYVDVLLKFAEKKEKLDYKTWSSYDKTWSSHYFARQIVYIV